MVVFSLTLIRHGETCANKDSIIQGQMDVPLSEAGVKQAGLLGSRLQNQKFTHIFVSDLTRAKQTVQSILEKNKFNGCQIVEEPKLRERKFGEVEGKTFNELKKLARRANQTVPNFTPSGAETAKQVRQRAVLFFQELCQLVLKNGCPNTASVNESGENLTGNAAINSPKITAGVKRRHSNISCDGGIFTNEVARHPTDVPEPLLSTCQNMKAGTGSYFTNTNHCGKPGEQNCFRLDVADGRAFPLNSGTSVTDQSKDLPVPLCVYVPSWRYRNKLKREGKKGIQVNPSGGNLEEVGTAKNASTTTVHHHTAMFNNSTNEECPNVSLCPSLEGRLSQVPCVEHDRKMSIDSSNDDLDAFPCLTANVLVVSHGGLLREIVRYFVEDLGCSVPGGKAQALRIGPNTGLSKFTVSFVDIGEKPKVICLLIHDKDHLVENGMNAVHSSVL